jgi:hypothetical protein
LSALAAVLLCCAEAPAQTQAGGASVVNRSGAPADVERIIRAFTQKETEFRKALNEYGFRREAVVQTIAWGGQVSGEYLRVSSFVFDDSGNRFEKILKFPIPTISEIQITPEDLEDLGGVQAFALESSKIGEYDFAYAGKEKIDEVDTYVFDVTPKILSDQRRLAALKKSKETERYFQGRIWVDDQDYQIVKARGKGVPEIGEQQFVIFETYREQVDGKYWFPTYAYADDELNAYVFDVTPKFLSDPARVKAVLKSKQVARYFQGRVWIEERDLQVVKARGKGVPEDKNHRYPTFETYREQVDGKYWFPTYTYADDELVFGNGNVERVRMRIKFTDYERLRGKATVVEEGKPGDTEKKDDKKPATPPTKP